MSYDKKEYNTVEEYGKQTNNEFDVEKNEEKKLDICSYCHEEFGQDDTITSLPCQCKGSLNQYHSKCQRKVLIVTWQNAKNSLNLQCPICTTNYSLMSEIPSTYESIFISLRHVGENYLVVMFNVIFGFGWFIFSTIYLTFILRNQNILLPWVLCKLLLAFFLPSFSEDMFKPIRQRSCNTYVKFWSIITYLVIEFFTICSIFLESRVIGLESLHVIIFIYKNRLLIKLGVRKLREKALYISLNNEVANLNQ